jgi:hypothetical protein
MSVKGIADHIFGDPDVELNKRKAIAQELIDQWEAENGQKIRQKKRS